MKDYLYQCLRASGPVLARQNECSETLSAEKQPQDLTTQLSNEIDGMLQTVVLEIINVTLTLVPNRTSPQEKINRV